MPVFPSIYYMWGEDFFFQFLRRFVFGFQMPLANELISASCVTASIKLTKTMQYYTTTNNIPLVSGPSTALAEYFHLFPAVMHLRLLHTGYKSVIKRNCD